MGLVRRSRSWLSWKWLWLSHVYPFYWAHKPLCERFRRDVLRIGRLHLCRSCTMVYAGIALGVLLSAVFHEPLHDAAPALFAVLAGVTLTLSCPVWYRRWTRPVRDALRGMTGATIALAGYLLFSGSLLPGLIGLVVLGLTWKAYQALRGSRHPKACDGCPQLRENEICPGFALQAECIRQYEQEATDLLLSHGYLPDAVQRQTGP